MPIIDAILRFSLTRRLLVLLAAFAIAAAGTWSWVTLQKEAYPDVGDTQVTVITEFPGRAAQEVESQITIPLERALNSVPRIINRRSKTIFGLSVIYLTFDDGVDDYWARNRVLEYLPNAELPEGVAPKLAPLTGPVGEILRYVVTGDLDKTPMTLRTIQDWVVIPHLLQVPGVADVITFGGLVKQYHVVTTPDKLFKYGLTIDSVIQAIQSNNLSTGGNSIRQGGQAFVVRGLGSIQTNTDLETIVLHANRGVPVLVRDIGSVEQFPMSPSGILGYSTHPTFNELARESVASAVQGLVAMRRGENVSDVVHNLKIKIANINQTLPPGVTLNITYDREKLVDYTIHTVAHTVAEGITVVLVILVFFMGSVRSALVVATVIPLSLLVAFLMMKLTGISVNLLSLGAIDFGIIVDSAVVMVENILHRYQMATPDERANGFLALTLLAAREVSREIFFSIGIIISAYIPIFTFQRVEGKLFAPMAYTLAFAIMGSMVLALTLIPALMSMLFRKKFENREPMEWHNRPYQWFAQRYANWVAYWTARPVRTMWLSLLMVVGVCGFCGMRIGSEFLPKLDEGSITIRCYFPVGISLQEANKYARVVRDHINQYKATKMVITQLGRNEDGTDPYSPNRMEVLVMLHDYDLWRHQTTKEQLLDEMKRELTRALPGVSLAFSQPILDNVNEAVTGSVGDLAVMISGDELGVMRVEAKKVLGILKNIPGATEYGIEQEADQAQLVIELDRPKIARYGINVADVTRVIEAAIGGKPVGKLFEDGRRFDIVVRYASQYRSSVQAIEQTMIAVPNGPTVPLSELASIRLKEGPTLIQRQDGKRQVSVRVNVVGRDQGGFVKEAQAKVNQAVHLPPGYTMTWGGQFENLTRSVNRLKIVIPVTIAIIFLILYTMYRRVWDVLIAFSPVPFALSGGLLALVIRGYNMNVSAAVGFISLFGISTMSGILFVSRMRSVKRSPLDWMTPQHVLDAANVQLRPWLTTVLPALFGLIPACMAHGVGSDIQRPLATVIVGGLLTGLVLTITALPSIYLCVDRFSTRVRRRRQPDWVYTHKADGTPTGLAVLVLLLGITGTIGASGPTPVTLAQLDAQLVSQNLELSAARRTVEAARFATVQAGAHPNPNFSIEQNIYNPITGKYFELSPLSNTEFSIQQPVALSGRLGHQVAVAALAQKAAEWEYRRRACELQTSLRVAFYSAYYLQDTLQFYDRYIDALNKSVAASERLLASRSVLAADVLRLKSLRLTIDSERLSVSNQIRDIKRGIQWMVGQATESPDDWVPTADPLVLAHHRITISMDAAVQRAFDTRAEYQLALLQRDTERANLALQRSLGIPDVVLGLHYSKAGSFVPDYYAATVAMDLPVFNQNQGAIRQSEVAIEKWTALQENVRRKLESDVKAAYAKALAIDALYWRSDRTLATDYAQLAEKFVDAYIKQNIGIMAFTDFLESYRTSVWQLNQLCINRMVAFEELNASVGEDVTGKGAGKGDGNASIQSTK